VGHKTKPMGPSSFPDGSWSQPQRYLVEDVHEERPGVRVGFARACLGDADDVSAGERERKRLGLDWRGFLEALFSDLIHELFVQVELRKADDRIQRTATDDFDLHRHSE
jgi:hypothetical protein